MKKIILISVLSLVGIAGAAFVLGVFPQDTLAQGISKCNTAATEFRFSCFRSVIEKNFAGEPVKEYLEKIEKDSSLSFESKDNSYAVFGANCHTFYHALGDFVATRTDGDIGGALNMGTTRCTNGYMMGFYKRTALENGFEKEVLQELFRSCQPESVNSCAHEIGHLLHDKYSTSILKTLDGISKDEYGLEYAAEYKYTLSPQPDLNKPFDECKEVLPEEKWSYCYQGIGHNLFVYSEFSPEGYKTQFAECSGVLSEESQEQCHAFLLYRVGINDGATRFLSYDYDGGNAVCQGATDATGRADLKRHCYLGIGGGIGLYLESEYPYDKITEENLELVKQRTLEVAELCSHSEEGFEDKCYAGLLGSRFKDMYKALRLYQEDIERLLPELDEGLEVI
ncbi:MAG: hypothetical protein Q8P12_07635, partial [bacterium]|nr:hypothetical protein [bacterium]